MKKIAITVLILGIVGFGSYFAYLAKAAQDSTTLSQQITGGSLAMSVTTTLSFTAVNYSFNAQTSTKQLDDINPKDERGTAVGWNVNVTGADWTSDGVPSLDYDGSGADNGRLTIDTATSSATCSATIGDLTGISIGSSATFLSGSVTTITIITASNTNGDGDYDCDDFDLSQYIPGSQEAETYTTTLTFDLQ